MYNNKKLNKVLKSLTEEFNSYVTTPEGIINFYASKGTKLSVYAGLEKVERIMFSYDPEPLDSKYITYYDIPHRLMPLLHKALLTLENPDFFTQS